MMLSGVFNKVQTTFGYQEPYEDTAWVDTLTDMPELEALIEIKEQLSKIDFLKAIDLEDKLDLVLDVDERAIKKVKKITHHYLSELKGNRSQHSDTQVVVYGYYRQLYGAYTYVLECYQNQKKLTFSPEKLNLMLARYLNATFSMAKWRYFDDQPVPACTWDYVHKAIKIAEKLAVMNKRIFLYGSQIKETSIASILKRGFMLNTLQKGNYNQVQIELTDRVLKIWATNPMLVDEYKQDSYQFFIQLTDDRGPERVRGVEPSAESRYWKTTRLVDLMESYLCAESKKESLETFGLEKTATKTAIVRLFKKLRVDWCVEGYERQRRTEPRSHQHGLLNVSHGLGAICHRLIKLQAKRTQGKAEHDNTFSEPLDAVQHAANKTSRTVSNENWQTVDESSSGFAVDFGEKISDWLEPGALIGYTESENKSTLSIAEVMSVRKQVNGAYRAGFKVVTRKAMALAVSRLNKNTITELATGFYLDDDEEHITCLSTFSGLFIEGDVSGRKSASNASISKLIVPYREYKQNESYSISIDGDDHQLLPGRILSKHRGWVCFEAIF